MCEIGNATDGMHCLLPGLGRSTMWLQSVYAGSGRVVMSGDLRVLFLSAPDNVLDRMMLRM